MTSRLREQHNRIISLEAHLQVQERTDELGSELSLHLIEQLMTANELANEIKAELRELIG